MGTGLSAHERYAPSPVITGREFRIAARLQRFPVEMTVDLVKAYGVVLPDQMAMDEVYEKQLEAYGPLLFLGLILGIAFIFAITLIIYYKQISEGYEDRDRFQIMQKIGMSEPEVRKTIRSQLIYVFLLPLIVAGVHMVFAFPILEKILKVLQLGNAAAFARSAVIVYAGFAAVYLFIYFMTTKVYYKIIH